MTEEETIAEAKRFIKIEYESSDADKKNFFTDLKEWIEGKLEGVEN